MTPFLRGFLAGVLAVLAVAWAFFWAEGRMRRGAVAAQMSLECRAAPCANPAASEEAAAQLADLDKRYGPVVWRKPVDSLASLFGAHASVELLTVRREGVFEERWRVLRGRWVGLEKAERVAGVGQALD